MRRMDDELNSWLVGMMTEASYEVEVDRGRGRREPLDPSDDDPWEDEDHDDDRDEGDHQQKVDYNLVSLLSWTRMSTIVAFPQMIRQFTCREQKMNSRTVPPGACVLYYLCVSQLIKPSVSRIVYSESAWKLN